MSPISWVWLWRGLQGRSITFAALFGSLVLGVSIMRAAHHVLSALGFHWIWVLALPLLLFSTLAGMEDRWIPDPRRRQIIALSIILGSTAVAVAVNRLTAPHPPPAPITR